MRFERKLFPQNPQNDLREGSPPGGSLFQSSALQTLSVYERNKVESLLISSVICKREALENPETESLVRYLQTGGKKGPHGSKGRPEKRGGK